MQKIHVDHWINIDNLVGGFNPSEKYEFVSWDDDSQLNGKSLKIIFFIPWFQSPPSYSRQRMFTLW
jgi:hypothetical protein